MLDPSEFQCTPSLVSDLVMRKASLHAVFTTPPQTNQIAQPPDASPQIKEEPVEAEAWGPFRKFEGWSLITGGINSKDQLWASGFTGKTDSRLFSKGSRQLPVHRYSCHKAPNKVESVEFHQ